MECIIEHSMNNSIIELFKIGEPNNNHYLIAELIKCNFISTVLTTNFDSFIEICLDKSDVKYNLIYKEEDFDNNILDGDVKIVKLHGSIHDIKNMSFTIKKVSSKEIISQRKKILNTIFNDPQYSSILFLGYSCSDLFDINPCLNTIDKKINVLYFNHSSLYGKLLEFQLLDRKSEPNPFLGFKGYNIIGNTDEFLTGLWAKIKLSKIVNKKIKNDEYIKVIDNWINELLDANANSPSILYYISGQLLNLTSNYTKALEYFNKGYTLTKKNTNISIDFLHAIGRTYRELQKSDEALEKSEYFLFKGLKESRKLNLKKKECFILLSLGIVFEDKKQHRKAITYYKKSLNIANEISEIEVVSKCLGNMGIVYKNWQAILKNKKRTLNKSLQYQRQSLEISQNIGDKRSEGRTLGNIGILLSNLNKKKEAIEYYLQALKISIDLSDFLHQGIWNYNIGFDYIDLDKQKAKNYISDAKKIFNSRNLENHVRKCEETLMEIIE